MAQKAGWGHVLAGLANGYVAGSNLMAAREKSDDDRAYMEERRARERKEWADEDSLRADLKAASAPVAVVQGAGGMTLPVEMDNRDVGLAENAALPNGGLVAGSRVGAQAFTDPAAAQQAVTQANLPETIAGRQAAVYNARGMVEKAAALEARQAALQKTALEWKEKGILDGIRKFRTGDRGAIDALKKSGMFDPDGDVKMEPEEMDIPGVGKIKTYTATFMNKGADGTLSPVRLNSHELAMASMPYEKQLEVMGKGVERQDKQKDREERAADRAIDNKRADALAAATIGLRAAQTNRAERPAASGSGRSGSGGADKASKEGRLVVQTLLSNVGREMKEVDAGIKEEQKNMFPGDPPTPRMKELVMERSRLAQRRGSLNEELESIPRPSTGAAAAKEQAPPKTEKTARGELPKIVDQAQYNKLPSGARYIAPDGSQRVKK